MKGRFIKHRGEVFVMSQYDPNQNNQYQQAQQPQYQQQYQQNQYQQNQYQQYQQAQYQQQYQQYPQNQYQQQYAEDTKEEPLSVGQWILTILVMSIPLVNLIMLFVWGFGSEGNKGRANFCKAQLIWIAIGIGLAIVLGLLFGSIFASILSGLANSGAFY